MEMEDYNPEDDLRYDIEIQKHVSLLWQLIEEIQDANAEIVSLRYLLSNYMTEWGKEYMRMDIFDALYPFYAINYEYLEWFAKQYNNGKDPFDDREYWAVLKKAGKGKKINGHPNIYLPNLK